LSPCDDVICGGCSSSIRTTCSALSPLVQAFSIFQKWGGDILLKEAPPVVFADLGYGILDSAMVKVEPSLGEGPGSGSIKTVFCGLERFRRFTYDGGAVGTAGRYLASSLQV